MNWNKICEHYGEFSRAIPFGKTNQYFLIIIETEVQKLVLGYIVGLGFYNPLGCRFVFGKHTEDSVIEDWCRNSCAQNPHVRNIMQQMKVEEMMRQNMGNAQRTYWRHG